MFYSFIYLLIIQNDNRFDLNCELYWLEYLLLAKIYLIFELKKEKRAFSL